MQSWTEAEDKFPDGSGEVEKFVPPPPPPKVYRKQIVPEYFWVFVDASTAEEQTEIVVSIELTVNGQSCEAQYCKSGNFRENFIFANCIKRHICDV